MPIDKQFAMNDFEFSPSNAIFNEKYLSKNPISRALVDGFNRTIYELVASATFDSIVDVGCGEGFVLNYLLPLIENAECSAIDVNPDEVEVAERNLPFCRVSLGSAYEIPLESNGADLVLCTEVLEHLEDPRRALAEITRVARQSILLTVPREPIWRILNMLRGAYWSDWGNTPDHRQNWSTREFCSLVSEFAEIRTVKTPLPWTVIFAQKK